MIYLKDNIPVQGIGLNITIRKITYVTLVKDGIICCFLLPVF